MHTLTETATTLNATTIDTQSILANLNTNTNAFVTKSMDKINSMEKPQLIAFQNLYGERECECILVENVQFPKSKLAPVITVGAVCIAAPAIAIGIVKIIEHIQNRKLKKQIRQNELAQQDGIIAEDDHAE